MTRDRPVGLAAGVPTAATPDVFVQRLLGVVEQVWVSDWRLRRQLDDHGQRTVRARRRSPWRSGRTRAGRSATSGRCRRRAGRARWRAAGSPRTSSTSVAPIAHGQGRPLTFRPQRANALFSCGVGRPPPACGLRRSRGRRASGPGARDRQDGGHEGQRGQHRHRHDDRRGEPERADERHAGDVQTEDRDDDRACRRPRLRPGRGRRPADRLVDAPCRGRAARGAGRPGRGRSRPRRRDRAAWRPSAPWSGS